MTLPVLPLPNQTYWHSEEFLEPCLSGEDNPATMTEVERRLLLPDDVLED